MLAIIGLPQNLVATTTNTAFGIVQDFLPVIYVLGGLVLGFFLLEVLVGLVESIIYARMEAKTIAPVAGFKTSFKEKLTAVFQRSRAKRVQTKGLSEIARFKEVMKGKGISRKTK